MCDNKKVKEMTFSGMFKHSMVDPSILETSSFNLIKEEEKCYSGRPYLHM